MTWGSDRSGMASSETRRAASVAANAATRNARTTNHRFLAHRSMMRPIMGSFHRRLARGRFEGALGVDHEGGARDDPIALPQALGDLDVGGELGARRHRARNELAGALF